MSEDASSDSASEEEKKEKKANEFDRRYRAVSINFVTLIRLLVFFAVRFHLIPTIHRRKRKKIKWI